MQKVLLFLACACLLHAAVALKTPFVSAYWETWEMMKVNDYASHITKIPCGDVGSGQGLNLINMAFANYYFVNDDEGNVLFGYINEQNNPDGTRFSMADMQAAVKTAHDNGCKVKVSFGGASMAMISFIRTKEQADQFAQQAVKAVVTAGLDGVDFDIEDAVSGSEIQIEVMKKMREYLPKGMILSYTIPATGEKLSPWKEVLPEIKNDVDFFNVMAYDVYDELYDARSDFQAFVDLGIPLSKMVWGIMPGAHDCPTEYTNLTMALQAASYARDNGMAGVMIWDANRDTDHRSRPGALYQTGMPDGTYIMGVAAELQGAGKKKEFLNE